MYTWARYSENNYEVSTKGDKRFSPLVAKLSDGRTIEEAYQLDVKGYRRYSNDWRYGKGKKPVTNLTIAESYIEYKKLWNRWLDENLDMEIELSIRAEGKVLTDQFASTSISQARALAELLNERTVI